MIYALQDLLIKMGAPDVPEKRRIEWHYFTKDKKELAGSAVIRLEAGGEHLIAELHHLRENYEDDSGKMHPLYKETFYFYAERTARPGHFRVTRISLDGDIYDNPAKAIVELGLSVFHARALDISLRMVEQAFNKQDILEPQSEDTAAIFKKAFGHMAEKEMPANNVVIPFRKRQTRLSA